MMNHDLRHQITEPAGGMGSYECYKAESSSFHKLIEPKLKFGFRENQIQ